VFVSLSVFYERYPKNDAADTETFLGDAWKTIYYVVKRSKNKIASHKNIAGVGVCTLVSAGFF